LFLTFSKTHILNHDFSYNYRSSKSWVFRLFYNFFVPLFYWRALGTFYSWPKEPIRFSLLPEILLKVEPWSNFTAAPKGDVRQTDIVVKPIGTFIKAECSESKTNRLTKLNGFNHRVYP